MTRQGGHDAMPTREPRKLTGRKVLFIALSAFGVVVAVNALMATLAVGGFPGLVVQNPYVAGQEFDAEVKAEKALGWRFGTEWRDGELAVSIVDAIGAPPPGLEVSALVGRPATEAQDREVALERRGAAFVADLDLDPGAWRVEITARRGGEPVYTIADDIYVREEAAR
jgi:nitrogen fixation protein FixH